MSIHISMAECAVDNPSIKFFHPVTKCSSNAPRSAFSLQMLTDCDAWVRFRLGGTVSVARVTYLYGLVGMYH